MRAETVIRVPKQTPSDDHVVRYFVVTLVRAARNFLRRGDLFSSAAISFYALFSLLPLAILLISGLRLIFPPDAVMRNIGRLFGGLAETNILVATIREAYAQERSLGWWSGLTLVLAAAGVFTSVQTALDRIWEHRGRIFHLRLSVGMLTMAASLMIFLGMLVLTILIFRWIRASDLGVILGIPRTPRPGARGAITTATALAQFGIFWTAYRFLSPVSIRWRDALPGAVVAAVLWHTIGYVLGWYLAFAVDYATLYRQLQTIAVLLVWLYSLAGSFLYGAEFVAQWTTAPRSGRSRK